VVHQANSPLQANAGAESALSRRGLAVALWRYLQRGVIAAGQCWSRPEAGRTGSTVAACLCGPPMAARQWTCSKVYSPLKPCQPCLKGPRRRQLARLRGSFQALVRTNVP